MPSLPVALQNYIYGYQRLQLLPEHFQEKHNAQHRAAAGRVGGGSSPELGLSRNGKSAFIKKKINAPVL